MGVVTVHGAGGSRFARSWRVTALGAWLVIAGAALDLGTREVYVVGAPIPLVGGLQLFVLPAATVAALGLAQHVALLSGFVLIAVAALQRARLTR